MKRTLLLATLIASLFSTPAFSQDRIIENKQVRRAITTDAPAAIQGQKGSMAEVYCTNCTAGGGAASETTLSGMSAKLPASLGAKTAANSLSITPATDAVFAVGTHAVTQSGTWNIGTITTLPAITIGNTGFISTGNVGAGTTDSGNGVKVSCVFTTASPAVATTQRQDLQCTDRGSLIVAVTNGAGGGGKTELSALVPTTDALSNAYALLQTAARLQSFNGSTWDRVRGDTTGLFVQQAPTAATTNALAPVVGSGVSNVAGKTTAGNLYSVEITTGATAGYLYVFNATATPSDGAVTAGTASGNYQFCAYVAATSFFSRTYDIPESYTVGIRPVFSTTACGTLTASTTPVFLKARVK